MSYSVSEQLLGQFHHFISLIQRWGHQQHFNPNGLNINHGQGHLLGVLLVHDGLTQTELSTQLRIRPSSLGELVNKLEQSGYVRRHINENDKRVFNVYLTEEGRKVGLQVMKARQEAMATTFPGLSEDEKHQLSTLMGKLITSMEEKLVDNKYDLGKENMDLQRDSWMDIQDFHR
jgi:DNA-binding MarR family transcriptional regulator